MRTLSLVVKGASSMENGRYRGLVICEKLLEMLSVVKGGQDRGFCRGLAPSKADHISHIPTATNSVADEASFGITPT